MRKVEQQSLNGETSTKLVTPDVYAFLLGTPKTAWPINVPMAQAYFAYMLGLREARAMKKRKRPPPRGKGYRSDIEARSLEAARAALSELLIHQLIFVVDDVDFINRMAALEDPPGRVIPDDGETYYSLGSVADALRRNGR